MASVSVCMIVKNEEKVLKRCLDSLQGLWDELIIVDTGSEDRTKEIAAAYTDKVFDFAWIDDFSAARNYAFSKAACDYVYSADADEYLDDTNRERFLQLKENLLPEIEVVQMWYVTPEEYNTTENFERQYRPKLYKRLRTPAWIDPIHEIVRMDPVVYDSDIEILHKPHDMHASRDFRVFRKHIEKGLKLSARLHTMYARELLMSGEKEDFALAAEYFRENKQEAGSLGDTQRYQEALCVLAKAYRMEGAEFVFLETALDGIATVPCSEICVELGIFYFDKKEYEKAASWFEKAMYMTAPALVEASGGQWPEAYLHKIEADA
ncbi:MAG: glycosyltransferase family 2 protein [Lachnospiraceae bacterium]|nr:glycosyltransferase family 2 protein [Lachnospiraceae bacterium]